MIFEAASVGGLFHSSLFSLRLETGSFDLELRAKLTLQLHFLCGSESMGNHDSDVMDAGSVD